MRHPNEHGRLYRSIEAAFNVILAGYRVTLDIVLRHQAITLLVFFVTISATILMMVQIPKGFIPKDKCFLIFAKLIKLRGVD